jgi:5-formyltetrahydrofolate cyclo-ligase
MAVPKLSEARPFILLDPDRVTAAPRRAVSIRGAAQHGRSVAVSRVRHVDLIVCGSVAVNRGGVRVGKGGGYSDLEFALLRETGAVDERTVIVTTVHPVQVRGEELPETEHDFRVDVIVTPDEVIRPAQRTRPPGILWDHLEDEKVEAIPALGAIARRRGTRTRRRV